jgi:hypothetical protein
MTLVMMDVAETTFSYLNEFKMCLSVMRRSGEVEGQRCRTKKKSSKCVTQQTKVCDHVAMQGMHLRRAPDALKRSVPEDCLIHV